MRKRFLFTLAIALLPSIARAERSIVDIDLRVLLAETGEVSDPLERTVSSADLTVIPDGGKANSPAYDMLVVVKTEDDGRKNRSSPPLLIQAFGSNGKLMASKTQARFPKTESGDFYVGLWLANITCAGLITVIASYGKQKVVDKIPLNCSP